MKSVAKIFGCVVLSTMLAIGLSGNARSATMNDYCIIPPFIQEIAKPNLLMIIDNSASMYDLAYVDKGKKHCSVSTGTDCFVDSDCPKHCSASTATSCEESADCPANETCVLTQTCSVFDRNPLYCNDQTFSAGTSYAGYFDPSKKYQYNFATELFTAVNGSIPDSCAIAESSTVLCKIREDVVHLNIDTSIKPATNASAYLYASGSFLNWLTASKFDVEKQALTGGKYVTSAATPFLQPESRGCVGQGFIKKVLTADFVNYNSPSSNDTNTSLGLTISIKGPSNPNNDTAPSTGGQTYINIYNGNDDNHTCDKAIETIGTVGTSQTDWRNDIEACLNYDPHGGGSVCSLDNSRTCIVTDPDCKVYTGGTSGTCTYTRNSTGAVTTTPPSVNSPKSCYEVNDCSVVNNYSVVCAGATPRTLSIDYGNCITPSQSPAVKSKVAFIETVQTCWSYSRNGTLGTGDVTRLTSGGKCSAIYAGMGVCSNDAGTNCYADTDCGTGNTCNKTGPASILAGDPAIICGTGYMGQFYLGSSPTWSDSWSGSTKHCYNDTANSIGGVCAVDGNCTSPATCQEDSVIQYRRFCNDTQAQNVTDPTDSPSDTSSFDNLPALISGIGVEAQLGKPILSIPARVVPASEPTHLVQEFGNKIRFGLMTFNNYGSASETPSLLSAAKVCSNDDTLACVQNLDCGTGNTCGNATNKDGAYVEISALIGLGHCSATTGTECTKTAHCPNGETCVSNGVGDHTSGLVRKIDDLRAATWTPFAEAYYNAIGYFAVSSSDATGKTSRTDLRLNSGDFPDAMNPSEYVCQANNILLVTDGASTADQNSTKTALVDVYKAASGNVTGTCPKYAGSQDLDDLAWLARHRNINTFSTSTATTTVPLKKNESIASYIVFNGADNGESGDCNNVTLLSKAAENGGTKLLSTDIPAQYEDTLRRAFEAVAGGTASGTAASILSNSEGSGANVLQAVFYPSKEFETVSGEISPTSATWIGEMQNLWYYVDPYIGNSTVREDTNLNSALDIQNDFVTEYQFKGGETIAVLKKDDNKDGSGETVVTSAMDARVKDQGYCSITSDTKCSTDAGCPAGETCNVQGIVNADDVRSLWRAGKLLWDRSLTTAPRKLYTYLYGSGAKNADGTDACSGATFSHSGLYDLATINWNSPDNDTCIVKTLLQAANDTEAKNIIKFIQGYDHSDYDTSAGAITETINIAGIDTKPRNRSVQIGGTKKVWKLGDIISSTPRIQSFNKLNNYNQDAPAGYGDLTYADNSTGKGYANSNAYKARGMAYAGANDGMLHAFKLGSLAMIGFGDTKATLTNPDNSTPLGHEQWTFIPKNVLPYLKYLADPDYSHLYLVDGPTRLVDASIGGDTYSTADPYASTGGCGSSYSGDIHASSTVTNYWACKRDSATDNNNSWRTLLIGSMGIGGSSHDKADACHTCVKNPVPGAGNSSYFALDVTDPESPKYMWEFSDPLMGFATTGAAVVRIRHEFVAGGTTYNDTNGRWFAVVGNGPTGPIDTTYHQFKGRSRNPLRAFVLDLKSGTPLETFTTSINSAFSGQMGSAPIDTDRFRTSSVSNHKPYSDDALYFGYSACTSNCGTGNDVWDGGIMRLLTDEDMHPSNWSLSTLVSGIGPVTTSIGKLQDRKYKNLWLYTGSGRYFFKGDDSTVPGKILAVKEPCYDKVNNDIYALSTIDAQSPKCSTTIAFNSSDFADQTSAINSVYYDVDQTSPKKGWFIDLGAEDNVNHFGAERIITEPVPMPNGAVFFTSFLPSTDICNYGGKSYLWGMRYDTGGTASGAQLKGKALVQVSTGSFEEVDLSSALTAELGRRMAAPMIGKPPTDPPPIISGSGNKPLKRILHIQEK